jgi:hypothetical protein
MELPGILIALATGFGIGAVAHDVWGRKSASYAQGFQDALDQFKKRMATKILFLEFKGRRAEATQVRDIIHDIEGQAAGSSDEHGYANTLSKN